MSATISAGDRVKFLGVDAEAQDRKDQGITGTEGVWPLLSPGAVGTVSAVVPAEESDGDPNNLRLFVQFDEVPDADSGLAALLGMPSGWPVLSSEVEAYTAEDAA